MTKWPRVPSSTPLHHIHTYVSTGLFIVNSTYHVVRKVLRLDTAGGRLRDTDIKIGEQDCFDYLLSIFTIHTSENSPCDFYQKVQVKVVEVDREIVKCYPIVVHKALLFELDLVVAVSGVNL